MFGRLLHVARHARTISAPYLKRAVSSSLRVGVVVAGVAGSGAAVASCDPVQAVHTLWTYLTVTRKEIRLKKEMKEQVLRVRDEFHLKNVDVESLYERFHSFSRTHHAYLTHAELKAALKDMGVTDAAVVDTLFEFFDADQNGAISFHEFVVATSIFMHGSSKSKASFMHSLCDRHRTGSISHSDLRDTIKTLLLLHARLAEPLHLDGSTDWVLDGLDVNARSQVIANLIAKAVFTEAATKNDLLGKEAFQAWIAKDSHSSRLLVSLFDDLEHQFVPPLHHPPPAPKGPHPILAHAIDPLVNVPSTKAK